MSTVSKQGKRPSSEMEFNRFRSTNLLDIPPAVQKALDSENRDARFISYKEYIANGGHHGNYWVPYKIDYAKMGINTDAMPSQDAAGFIRRGDLVLASRPKDLTKQHRSELQRRRNLLRDTAKSDSSKEFKEAARAAGARVVDGYDEE